tara:strand:+ start:2328 stop:3194 length:867 start_codon:yes stop_codon:yes gene_type:complete
MFAVLADDYTPPQTNADTGESTVRGPLDLAADHNHFVVHPRNIGRFLGRGQHHVLEVREDIRDATGLRLAHEVKDNAVVFRFCGNLHQKLALRSAYDTLLNTLGKRAIETGFRIPCDTHTVKFVLGRDHANAERLVEKVDGLEKVRLRFLKNERAFTIEFLDDALDYEETIRLRDELRVAVTDAIYRFKKTYIRPKATPAKKPATARTFSLGGHNWPHASYPPSEASASDASTGTSFTDTSSEAPSDVSEPRWTPEVIEHANWTPEKAKAPQNMKAPRTECWADADDY